MKDSIQSMSVERSPEADSFSNRRLIRPSLSRPEHNHNHAAPPPMERRDRPERSDRPDRERSDRPDRSAGGKKLPPPESTNAENFYYQKQMQAKTPMVIVLRDGEQIHGVIEWYDRNCIKVNRNTTANLVIYKPSIKYMYKEGENEK